MNVQEFRDRMHELTEEYHAYDGTDGAEGLDLTTTQAEEFWARASDIFKDALRAHAETKRATHRAERRSLALAGITQVVAKWGSLVIFAPHDGVGVHVITTRPTYEEWDAAGRKTNVNGRLPVGLSADYVAWVDSLDEAKLVINRDCEIVRLPNPTRPPFQVDRSN